MKILVTGYTGQLGYDVVQQGIKLGFDMIGIGSSDLDITNEVDVHAFVNKLQPDGIIHCAAYTAVDKAEDDRESCWNVNVDGTKYLSIAAQQVNAKFLYISTDYVFDGKGDLPFEVTDKTSPIGYYGLTKYEGEELVKQLLDK